MSNKAKDLYIKVQGGSSLTVNFSVDDATPDTNQVITFTDLTVGATAYVWNFGDGTTSNLQNPTKSYEYAGTYTVTLAAESLSSAGIETKVNFIVCNLQPVFSTNIQMHNSALIGATPSNAIIVSGAISQWDDNINGYHRTQGTPANRPAYLFPAITAPNGIQYGIARYDGLNDFLTNNNAGFVRATGSFEVLLFRRTLAGPVTARVLLAAGTSNIYQVFQEFNAFDIGIFNGSTRNDLSSAVPNVWTLIFVHWNESDSFVDYNNLNRTFVLASPGATSSTGSTQAALAAGTNAAGIDVSEHIIYTSKPSDAEIGIIKQRITSQFGILWE